MIETRTYSAMLYDLAAEIRREKGCVTEFPEAVEEAAERLDEQTMAITVLIKAINSARSRISIDRQSLFDCHKNWETNTVTDEAGLQGLAEYDDALRLIDSAIACTKCYGRPEKSAKNETTVPAIVSYPTGSLGEPIDSKGGAA